MVQLQTPPRSRRRYHAKHEGGQDLIEAALVMPVLLLIILGIMEFGIIVWNYNAISNAAREGARYGIVRPDTDGNGTCDAPGGSDSILAVACRMTAGLDASRVTVETSDDCTDSGLLGCITITVSYDAQFISAPIIRAVGGDPVVHLRSSATMDLEQPRS